MTIKNVNEEIMEKAIEWALAHFDVEDNKDVDFDSFVCGVYRRMLEEELEKEEK